MKIGISRIVAIDDEPAILEALLLIFEDKYFGRIDTANSLEAAFSLPEKVRSLARLVLLDDNLGRISSFSRLDHVKRAFPSAAIVMMGALLGRRPEPDYKKAGIAELVHKPWANEQLYELGAKHLGEGHDS